MKKTLLGREERLVQLLRGIGLLTSQANLDSEFDFSKCGTWAFPRYIR